MQDGFRLPRRENQPLYVELWTEKDALTSVLLPICEEYHIPLVVNKGYSSASAMYQASRTIREAVGNGQEAVIIYVGDHDPSGIDMDRDIRERLEEFGAAVIVRPIALTMAQVREMNPPPNPAKITDPRAAKYIERHGNISWEVDAIPPETLHDLVRDEIEACTNMEYYEAVIEQEDRLKAWLLKQVSGDPEYTETVIDNESKDSDPSPPDEVFRDEED